MIRGTIDRVESYGTVVLAWINVGGETVVPIHFDHRPFINMCEARVEPRHPRRRRGVRHGRRRPADGPVP